MAKLSFPASPQTGDQYTGDNGVTYVYDGVKWIAVSTGGSGGAGLPSQVGKNGQFLRTDGITPDWEPVPTVQLERFKLNYNSSGQATSGSDLSAGISQVLVESGGDTTITFNSSMYNYPPGSVMIYGYDYTNNKYVISHMSTDMALREIAGNGTSGNPTVFNGSSAITIRLRLRENETGASRSFGTTTHAWIQFAMSN